MQCALEWIFFIVDQYACMLWNRSFLNEPVCFKMDSFLVDHAVSVLWNGSFLWWTNVRGFGMDPSHNFPSDNGIRQVTILLYALNLMI